MTGYTHRAEHSFMGNLINCKLWQVYNNEDIW
jgi:hypothetical protein